MSRSLNAIGIERILGTVGSAEQGGAVARGILPRLPAGLGYPLLEEIVAKSAWEYSDAIAARLNSGGSIPISTVNPRTSRSWFQDLVQVVPQIVGGMSGGGAMAAGIAATTARAALRDDNVSRPRIVGSYQKSIAQTEVPRMFDDLFEGFGDFMSDLVSEVDWGGALDLGVDVAGSFINGGSPAYAMPVAARTPPAIRPPMPMGAAAGRVVGRSFFNRYPNLATAIQRLRNAGQHITRSKLYSMMKRFGPDFLVSAGILTAAAVSELAMAGPGHRRMNPANSRALRRAARRIKSFHRLCGTADLIRRPRRSYSGGGCGTCGKRKCRC